MHLHRYFTTSNLRTAPESVSGPLLSLALHLALLLPVEDFLLGVLCDRGDFGGLGEASAEDASVTVRVGTDSCCGGGG